ncbi:T6SS phospholipase effector Tle1-like catalytic domain-containing protein [Paraburkholderia sp. SIMBA_030]|uniref:T6SS phospholipase effector Tle1-like catalytic domain-containing protein n=1 Tax=Paraburkholderia sp. SIMBA_030 TaxID=3085773 RepID=UPI00397E22BC
MQDWITDNHDTFHQALRTATELHAEEFMTCTTCEQQPWFSFFFDGTGNNRILDKPKQKMSNIALLFEGHVGDDAPLVVPLYYAGVGTPLDVSDPSWWEKLRDSEALGGGVALGSDVRLVKAEADFCQSLKANHKVSRIDVAVFGFSRGAALARAFVNRLLKKCEMKDGVPCWPCATALDGQSAPLHFRFLGLFDTVESVGLPALNLNSSMLMHVPVQVERCFHIAAGHELRACFPLTPVRNGSASCEQLVWPGVHSDIGGGYRPGEQGRSDQLARIALNRMRLEGAMSGVPFTAPSLARKDVHDLFEYDEDVKTLSDGYRGVVGIGGTLEAQVFAHMRLYYGWLKVRYGQNPSDLYKNVCSTDPEVNAQLQRIQQYHERLKIDADTMNWRSYLTNLWKNDRSEYERTIATAGGQREMNKPLSDEEAAYWEAWLNPPTLSPGLVRLFDQYVHDSRAGFLRIDSSGYFRPRQIIEPSGTPKTIAQPVAAPQLPEVDEDRHAAARRRIHDVHDLRAAAVVQLLLRRHG